MRKQTGIGTEIINDFSKKVIAIIEHPKTPEDKKLDRSIEFIIKEATRQKLSPKKQLALMTILFKTVIAPRLFQEMLENMCSDCIDEESVPYKPVKLKDESIGGMYG